MTEEGLARFVGQPTIVLQDFEGPLDLLLHLIKKAEVDIYDIPIARITNQYVDFLHQQQKNQLNIAGEYFVMAATLMSIKSTMLLPHPTTVDDEQVEEEAEDPRSELVAQLLEYQRYKKAAAALKDREEYRQREYTREAMAVPKDLVQSRFAPGVGIEELQRAFEQVIRRHHFEDPVTQTVDPDPVTVAQRIEHVVEVVTRPTRFEDLFDNDWTKDSLVTTFLAILDLTKHQVISLAQSERFGPLIVMPGPRNEEYRNNGEYRTD